MEDHEQEPFLWTPSSRQQSWGATIAIIVIVLMVVVGAVYAWNKRTSKSLVMPVATSTPLAH